ncbi:MAG: ABC transporter permease subunit [Desulfovibrionales bacterium]|nr:ABC transporter permease subunit [Desulfovibrionales bacterium]
MEFFHILTQQQTLAPIMLTFKTLGVASLLILTLGTALGYYLTGERTVTRSVVDFFVTLPLVFPPIASGFVLLMLLGRSGLFGQFLPVKIVFSFIGVVLASVVAGLPFMVKSVETALKGDLKKLIELSHVLGKDNWQTFWLVILPNIKRGIASGLFLALGRSLGEVGITLMLGGNILGKTNTLSLEIYNAVFSGEFDRAMVLATVIGVLSLSVCFILRRVGAQF